MSDNKRAFLRPLLWVYGAVGAFTAISILGPIILERIWSRKTRDNEGSK